MNEVTAELFQNCFTANWAWVSFAMLGMVALAAPLRAIAGANVVNPKQ
jgi:hypothetical protein